MSDYDPRRQASYDDLQRAAQAAREATSGDGAKLNGGSPYRTVTTAEQLAHLELRLARIDRDLEANLRSMLLSNVSLVLYGVAALLLIRRVVKLEQLARAAAEIVE